MKLRNGIFLLFVIVEVCSQVGVFEFGEDVLTNENDRGDILDDPLNFNILDEIDNVPSVDYFLEERPHDIEDRENEKVGAAHADPTLHKWKHKIPHTHSHSHSITHGNSHGFGTGAVVYPVDHQFSHQSGQTVHSQNNQFSTTNGHGINGPAVVYPVNHQFSHQSQSGGHYNNKQFSSQIAQGYNSNFPSGRPNTNQWDKGFQQTTHSSFNQNLNQQINNQNVHLSNQNSYLDNVDSSGKVVYPSDTFNPGVVNINGHSNTVIQSGTSKKYIASHNGQVFLHEKTGSSPFDKDDHLIGITLPVEEQIYWQNKPQVSDLQTSSGETSKPVVYDREMNDILNILDDRSFYLMRPEIEPSPKQKHAEDETHPYENQKPDQIMDEALNKNYYNEAKQKEEDEYRPVENSGDVDYNLESPNIIQIPYNNFFHSYDYNRNSRNRRFPRDINMKVLSDDSMLFNISTWKLNEMNSKLNDTLLEYKNVVDGYRKKITDKRESIFVDLLDSIIGQFQVKDYENSNEIRKRQKRAATITKLLNDPDARLDVPKTLDNIGVITRNAFEDERSPMYHVRQFIGSTKNAVLSAMKIPPQNLVIPSNYEITNIKPEEISEVEDNMVSGINPKILSRSGFGNSESMENYEEPYRNDPFGIVETFARVGGAIRDSVRSGQNTLNHISDIAHNARKIYQTTKNSAPRILLPYAKAPVLRSRLKETPLKKAIVISPKVLAIKDPLLGSSKVEQDFVSMGNILDAIGLTKPDKDQIDLEKIVLKMPGQGETRGIYIPPNGEVKSINGRILPNLREGTENLKGKARKQLGRIQEKVSSTNKVIKDSITRMRNDMSKTIGESKTRMHTKSDVLQMRERNNVENDINVPPQSTIQNDIHKDKDKKNEIKHFTKEEENEIIDEFLYNIFKIDANPKERSESVNISNKIKGNEKNYDEKIINSKRNKNEKKEPRLNSKNDIAFSDILPNIPESVLQETIKNITLDILKDEKKNESSKITIKKKSNKIHKENIFKRKKVNPTKRPRIALQSRFGDDEDSDTFTTTPNSTVLDFKGLDKNEEEAMRKVDEYVLNDIAAPMSPDSSNNEKVKNSFKLGNVLELIEEPSDEASSTEPKSEETEEVRENVPVFSSRNLLWFPDMEDNNEEEMVNLLDEVKKPHIPGNGEIVGLNLPPELMTPFMSRASNTNIDEVFDKRDEVQENSEDANSMRINMPSEIMVGSAKPEISHFLDNGRKKESSEKNTNGREMVGLNLPPELMKPFMARASNADIDKTFTSNEDTGYNGALNDNNEMQNYLPILMMPLRTTKSVKKTLDEFLKKENETKHQILNIQENRLKNSMTDDIPRSHKGMEQPVKAQSYMIPSLDPMKRMVTVLSDGKNCQTKKCYESPSSVPSNYQVPHYDEPIQNFMICVCISEDSDKPIPNNNRLRGNNRQWTNEVYESVPQKPREGVGQGRTSMSVSENLRKPFMGLGNGDSIKKFYAEYNGNHENGGDLFGSDEEHELFSDE